MQVLARDRLPRRKLGRPAHHLLNDGPRGVDDDAWFCVPVIGSPLAALARSGFCASLPRNHQAHTA
jgi:hypothetical protein